MSGQYKRSSDGDSPFEPFANFMQPTPESFVRMVQPTMMATASVIEMQAKLWHAAAQASREWFDFVGRRLEQDADFMKEVGTAQNPQAFMDACTRFSCGMAKDYQDEFTELSRLSSKAAGGTCEIMRDAADNVTPFAETASRP